MLLGLHAVRRERGVLYANRDKNCTRPFMRLERILTHRLIQISRVVLPILVIALVAFPAWNYYARLVKKAAEPSKAGPKLPGGVSVRTDGFTYSRTEAGQTKFTIHAKQSLGFKDDKYIL